MAGVGVEVGLEGLLGALLQIVVLSDELLELRLDIDNLLPRELEFDNGDASGLEVRQETDFIGLKEKQTSSLGIGTSGSSSDSVNVVTSVVRRVKLDDEVDGGNLEKFLPVSFTTTSCGFPVATEYSHPNHEQQHQCR